MVSTGVMWGKLRLDKARHGVVGNGLASTVERRDEMWLVRIRIGKARQAPWRGMARPGEARSGRDGLGKHRGKKKSGLK